MLNSGLGRPVPTGHQPVLAEPARTLGLVSRLEMVRTEMNRSHICQTDRARLDMQGRSISGLLEARYSLLCCKSLFSSEGLDWEMGLPTTKTTVGRDTVRKNSLHLPPPLQNAPELTLSALKAMQTVFSVDCLQGPEQQNMGKTYSQHGFYC